MLDRNFKLKFRPIFHTNPSRRKKAFWKRSFQVRKRFQHGRRVISLSKFCLNTNLKWPVVVAFSNFTINGFKSEPNSSRSSLFSHHKRVSMQRHYVYYLISFVMNISGVKFEEHCFYISRDILYSVFYNFSCTSYDVITFLICIIGKRQYL